MKKQSDFNFYFFEIIKSLKKYWPSYSLGILCVLFINALEMFPALSFKELTSNQEIDKNLLYKIGLLLLVSHFFIGIFRYGWRLFFMVNSRKVEVYYKKILFGNILKGKFHESGQLNVGDTVSKLSQDIYDFRMFVGPGVLVLVDIIGYMLFVPGLLYYILGDVAFIFLLPFLLIPVFMVYYNKKINKHYVQSSGLLGKVSDHVYEDTRGVKIFRVLGLIAIRRSKFDHLLKSLEKQRLLPHKFDIFLDTVISISICLSYSLLFLVGVKVMRGEFESASVLYEMGRVIFVLQIMDKLVWPMIALGWVASLTQKSYASLKRMRPLFEIKKSENGSEIIKNQITKIELNNFNFSYPESEKDVLTNLNLRFFSGQKIGIVGAVAEGKTTLLKILSGIYDKSEIKNSNNLIINDKSYNKIQLQSYRERLSYVPQDPVIFNDTLAVNISPIEKPNEARVWEALEHACLLEDIKQMPQGLNTFLGEKGINLSGGQKQRIAIARSFYSRAEVYYWDDTISALDVKTEKSIINSIFKINSKSILVLATHRLSALKNFDMVYVLKDKKVVEQGSYEDLVNMKSWFHKVQQIEQETRAMER